MPAEFLQLGLRLSLLQDRLHLCRLHDVPPDLQLSGHEESLSIGLARDEVGEVFVGEDEGDYITYKLAWNVFFQFLGSNYKTHHQPCRPRVRRLGRPRPSPSGRCASSAPCPRC